MKYFMNTPTGSVDTEENWTSEGFAPSENSSLVEVEKLNGEWVEV